MAKHIYRVYDVSMTVLNISLSDKGLLTFSINKPEVHNAFDDHLLMSLTEALKKYEQNKDVRALLIQSEGKSFCAGADLNWMKNMKEYSLDENIEDSRKLAKFFQALNHFPVPTIAKVQGAVFGGGLGILGAVDFVIAIKKSKFCFSETKLGLIPAVISPFVLPKLGQGRLRELFLSARIFTAEKAYDYGLVSDLAEDSTQLNTITDELIEQILNLGPHALRATKSLITKISNKSVMDCEDLTCEMIAKQRRSPEGQEGMQALLEKRKPQFPT